MMNAVLVGCGAMSKAWLNAARQIDGLAIVGLEENYQAAKTIGFPCSSCKPAPGRTSSAN